MSRGLPGENPDRRSEAPEGGAINEAPTFRDLQRRLAALIPDVPALESAAAAPGLEISTPTVAEAPRLVSAPAIEDARLRVHVVGAAPEPGFAAFLDGTQTSRVLQYAGATPAILGRVGAVIRARRQGRLGTWRMTAQSRLYAPLRLLDTQWKDALASLGLPLVDLEVEGEPQSLHPFAVQDLAIHQVQRHREQAEHELGREWCAAPNGILYVDGGLSGDEQLAKSGVAVGVVKSHRTLYLEPAELHMVFGLREGERTSVFRVTSPRRTPVASWYLRIRDAHGRDPLWGLVRVEASEAKVSGKALAGEADAISSWILAERTPISAPDSRWDTMAYGIRDCEEFLRASAVA